MSVVLELDVHSPSEAKNLAFARKTTTRLIESIIGTSLPYTLYGCQENNGIGTTIDNEQGDAGADMTLNDAGMNTGAGWYAPHRGPHSGGMRGFGLRNDGGALGYFGLIPDSLNVNVEGEAELTVIAMVNLADIGEVEGRICSKEEAYELYVSNVDEISFSVWDGAAYRTFTTNTSPLASFDYWHQIVATFNAGTVVVRVDGIIQGGGAVGLPAVITDAGNDVYVGDRAANDRALNGIIGYLGIVPANAFVQANVDDMQEIRGLFQSDPDNQPLIHTPGKIGNAEYDFDGAASPNSDHLFTPNMLDIKSLQGTVLFWFQLDSLVNTAFFGMSTDGATDDEFLLYATIGGGLKFQIYYVMGGAVSFQGNTPVGSIAIRTSYVVAFRSDGSTISLRVNNENIAIANIVGVNSGQWFGDATNANVFFVGARRRAVTDSPINGQVPKIIVRNDYLSDIEIDRLAQSSALGWNRSYAS